MFDFRYHALSLAAVLIALAVGLLIGVAIGDQGLVSSAEHKLRNTLHAEVREANRRADDLRNDLGQQLADARSFQQAAYPRLVGGQLRGGKVGLVFLGRPSDDIARQVRDALDPTDGQIVLRAVVREPLDLGSLADAAGRTRYAKLGGDPGLVEAFGFRMGTQLVLGGKLIGQVRDALLRSFNGVLEPLSAVVLVRLAPDLSGDQATTRDAFERGLVHGVLASKVPATGIETTSTDPSQVPWYRNHGLTSVDDVDRIAGQAALVFTLQGGVDGAFGVKSTAEAILPDVVSR